MKKINNFFASLKSLKKGVVSGIVSGSRSVSQRYGSPDPDQHQNVREHPLKKKLTGVADRIELFKLVGHEKMHEIGGSFG